VKADDYLRRVDAALTDLPWGVRRNLMAELKSHLEELPADEAARLGTPEEYAAEMRAAAGLERRRGVIAFLRARRPRNLLITVAVLTVIGLMIGAVVWIDSYQPLAFGNSYRLPNRSVQTPIGDSASVVVRRGRPFDLAVEVRNYGHHAVRVLGVPYPTGLPFKARVLAYSPSKYPGFVGDPKPFRPFDLQPGYDVVLELKGVYANCRNWRGQSGSMSIEDFPVRYSFLWRTATAQIPLPEELGLVFHKDSC
jgi:hypothetical protein